MSYLNKVKIGVCGGAHSPFDEGIKKKAFLIGKKIAENDCVLVSGATVGYPQEAARGAVSAGGISLGISPADGKTQHTKKYGYSIKYYDPIVYTGFGFQGRNVILIRSSDAVIFIGGGSGTLNEFTTTFRLGKPIGVLKGSGKISDNLSTLINICSISSLPPAIIHDRDPKEIVKKIYNHAQKIIRTL